MISCCFTDCVGVFDVLLFSLCVGVLVTVFVVVVGFFGGGRSGLFSHSYWLASCWLAILCGCSSFLLRRSLCCSGAFCNYFSLVALC